jgi:hypothetical protein
MEEENTERYEIHRYQINVEDCTKSIIKRIEIEITDSEEKTERIGSFQIAMEEYWNSIDISGCSSNIQLKEKYIIETTHYSFYNWLGKWLLFSTVCKYS